LAEGRVEVLHLGSACRDVDDADPRGWRLGGGVTYAALTTARLGRRTAAVIGVDAEAAGARELDLLRAAGVQVLAVPLAEGPIYHNIETRDGRIQTCVARGVPMPIIDLPDAWAAAQAWSFTPVAAEIHDEWTDAIPNDAFVVVGWQGFLRELVPGRRVQRRALRPMGLLRRADLVGVSRNDVDPNTTVADLCALLSPGASLLMTQGADGGQLVLVGEDGPEASTRYSSAVADEVDATGAGDTFLAALAASALVVEGRGDGATSEARPFDLRFAAAAGSLVVESIGLAGVPDRAAVDARVRRQTAVIGEDAEDADAEDADA
jgi:D-beta-D-heptose 7-phosphate kinase/D-beta-D-heptose 1-phosphate adenosyltransferase